MNPDRVKAIADAVLYEGYVLYPYRPSSVKNRQRFNFGVLAPRAYTEAERGSEACETRFECLVEGGPDAVVDTTVRFLHLVERTAEGSGAPGWQEAVEREVGMEGAALGALAERPRTTAFAFRGSGELAQARSRGFVLSRQEPVDGTFEVAAEPAGERLFRVAVRIENTTACEKAGEERREEALLSSLVSTHAVLGVRGGAFVSLLDPPGEFREAAAACRNSGLWPVLAGEEGTRDRMLASPIILYDYPQIAPESAGDLFDGTEIDEILTLRILTLTEDERREILAGDDRARRLLERTEAMPPEQLMKLHGAVRGLRPVREEKP